MQKSIEVVTPIRQELEAQLGAGERKEAESDTDRTPQIDFDDFENSLIQNVPDGLEALTQAIQQSSRYTRTLFEGAGRAKRA